MLEDCTTYASIEPTSLSFNFEDLIDPVALEIYENCGLGALEEYATARLE
jgi:hypothetical protein